MKVACTLLILAASSAMMLAQPGAPYLSHLNATASSPLFTTYAAAMERSEFTLDEGYHFAFYDSTRGADFVTDNAGSWSVGFRKGSRFVHEVRDMVRPPVITSSYADMVTYTLSPFQDVNVQGTFLVYSSHLAVQELVLKNTGTEPISLDIVPFLQSSSRPFSDVTPLPQRNAIAFRHEELPDSWVLDHGVPFVDRVQDLLVFSTRPDRMSSFRSFHWGSVDVPQDVDLKRPPVFVLRGAIVHQNKERCVHRQTPVRMAVTLNGDRRRLLTESAPRWGAADPNIRSSGSYAIEAGNFGTIKKGDRIEVVIGCGDTGETGRVEGIVGDTTAGHGQRGDLVLSTSHAPLPPAGVKRDIWGNGTELRLYWKPSPGMKYNVYRRDYRAGAVYDCVAYESVQSFFTDKNIADDKIYGYVVTSVDAQGAMSLPSGEVNNIEGSDFLTDTKYPGQVKGDAKDLSRVISAWKKVSLAPGATEQLRIVRAVYRSRSEPGFRPRCG